MFWNVPAPPTSWVSAPDMVSPATFRGVYPRNCYALMVDRAAAASTSSSMASMNGDTPERPVVGGRLLLTKTHCPEPTQRKENRSPAAVVMLAEPGSTKLAECVRTHAPVKRTSRRQPLKPVPRLVIVAAPVTYTDSASAVARSVVDAAAIVAEANAFVDRRMEA